MTLTVFTEDLACESFNPMVSFDLAPTPKLYQEYLRRWYFSDEQQYVRHNVENNPSIMTTNVDSFTNPNSDDDDEQRHYIAMWEKQMGTSAGMIDPKKDPFASNTSRCSSSSSSSSPSNHNRVASKAA